MKKSTQNHCKTDAPLFKVGERILILEEYDSRAFGSKKLKPGAYIVEDFRKSIITDRLMVYVIRYDKKGAKHEYVYHQEWLESRAFTERD